MRLVLKLAPAFPRRLGELCRMRWEDYAGGVMTLHDTKHPRKPRIEAVPVPPAARSVIDPLPRLDERILPYNSESVSSSFERACLRLGIEDLHFHDLRHEGICRLFESGLSIPEVAMISGHLSWTTLKRYTHLTPQHVLEKMDARP
jgi:integrase